MTRQILFIAAGSAIGGVARFLISRWMDVLVVSSFPFGTLLVNFAGCFLIGSLYAVALKYSEVSPTLILFLTTGFCGGFTTFSAFSYESLQLVKSGQFISAITYVLLSVIGGVLLTFLGFQVIK